MTIEFPRAPGRAGEAPRSICLCLGQTLAEALAAVQPSHCGIEVRPAGLTEERFILRGDESVSFDVRSLDSISRANAGDESSRDDDKPRES